MIEAENWSWSTLHTYEAMFEDPDSKPVDGTQSLIQMAQKYGG